MGRGSCQGHQGIFWVVETFCICRGVVVRLMYTTVKAHQNVHLESVHFIVRKLYLNFLQKKKLVLGLVTQFPGTVQSDFLAVKNSRSMAESGSCLLFAEPTPITARAAAASATRASFLFPSTYFPDK